MNRAQVTVIWTSWTILCSVFSSSVPRGDYGELKLFQAPVSYSVDTTVLLNDVSRKDKEVGYKIKASLNLAPVWSGGNSEFLLKFDLVSPQLHSRGTHISADFLPYKTLWDSHPYSTFYAHWKNGMFENCYLDASDPVDIINYKKALISLFQFQVIDAEHNETDVSGTCSVMYETLSMHIIRKIKRECWSADAVEGVDEGEDDGADGTEAARPRRLARYTLSGALDALDELYAEELVTAGDALSGVALKARAWQHLTRRAPPAAVPAPAPAATLSAALATLPAALAPHSLQLLPTNDTFEDDVELSALLAEAAVVRAEATGGGGDAAAARAALAAPSALRHAARPALARLLHEQQDPHVLATLCALLGLAGGGAAHEAAASFLQLHGDEPAAEMARHYLAHVALAVRPHEAAVLDVLRAARGPLAAPALLAAAAAAPRASPRAARAVRDALLKGLAGCKEDEQCEELRLRALGNLRRADCAEPLLAAAERARGAGPALAALQALRALPADAVRGVRDALHRLEVLALAPRRAVLATLDVRAAALELLLELSAPAPAHLQHTIRVLEHDEPELRRVLWAGLRALAAEHEPVRTLLRLLPPRLRSWHAQAAPGTSSALCREAGAWRGRRAELCARQLAARAMLRRGRVALRVPGAAADALAVELWARGLAALAGGDDPDQPAAGLALEVGGARLPGLTLFEGQGELLGHVWAGRGSEPTGVLRALQPLPERAARVPLLAGAALHWRLRTALSYALDAMAQVSLWSRSARAHLELRAALAARCEARVAAGGAALGGRVSLETEPRLRLAADLDFYDGVSLCVRTSLPAHVRALNSTLRAAAGALRVRRSRLAAHPAPARTLALGALNDQACHTLASADD